MDIAGPGNYWQESWRRVRLGECVQFRSGLVIFGRWSSLGELDFGGEGSQHFDLFPPALLTQAGADPNVE